MWSGWLRRWIAIRRRNPILRLRSRRLAIRRIAGSTMGLLSTQYQFSCDLRVKIFVLFELHVLDTSSAIKDLKRDFAFLLMDTCKSDDSLNSFHDLSAKNSCFG